jgi:hypothetical protein
MHHLYCYLFEIQFYIHSYDNSKKNHILKAYQPVKKYKFIEPTYNSAGGGDILPNGFKALSSGYMSSLVQMLEEDLDLIISTRFDINFLKNPFKEYDYDFTKFNFLWREPDLPHIPLVNDTFVVFPYSMLNSVFESIKQMELNPPHDVNIAMHNWYLTMVDQVGEENVQWVCDDFVNTITNKLYKLMRDE